MLGVSGNNGQSNGNSSGLTPTGRIANWSARHRWWVVGIAAAIFLVALFIIGTVETKVLDHEAVGEGEAAVGANLIDDRFDFVTDATEQLLFSNPSLDVNDPAYRSTVEGLVQELRALPEVESVTSYYDSNNPDLVSGDGHVLLASVAIAGDADLADEKINAILAPVLAADQEFTDFEIKMAGNTSLEAALAKVSEEDFSRILLISLAVGLIILLLAFRALVAAVIPLVLAIGAIFSAIGVATLVSHAYALGEVYTEVVMLMGLAVGIDYSLFVISRFRNERKAGRPKLEAITVASNTTGRAVFYAGIVVVVSLAGLMMTFNPIFTSIALGTIIVVLFAIIGSLTLIPALLSILGDNINRLRLPLVGRESSGAGIWGAISDRVLARPAVFATATAGILVALAAPVLLLNLGFNAGADAYPNAVEGKRALEILEENFTSGLTQPALVVVDHPDVNSPEVQDSVSKLVNGARDNELFFEPFETFVNDAGDLLYVKIPIAGNIDDELSERSIKVLRTEVIPAAFVGSSAEVFVTGQTAASVDFTNHMYARTPYVFAFVMGFAFLILMVMFRSIVIPAKAIVLNLLSVGAAYGVLVLVFQEGFGESITGFQSTGVIEAWLPLFIFGILFGLSMDYHMLLLNRIKEAYDKGESNEASVSTGIRATAGTITSAAAIMVGVFGAFALGRDVGLQQFGVGLGVAVLIDATIIRVVLLPASMKLLGDWNWYLPKWLEWLPKVAPEEGGMVAQPQPQPQLELLAEASQSDD